jgi:hypothetical protein
MIAIGASLLTSLAAAQTSFTTLIHIRHAFKGARPHWSRRGQWRSPLYKRAWRVCQRHGVRDPAAGRKRPFGRSLDRNGVIQFGGPSGDGSNPLSSPLIGADGALLRHDRGRWDLLTLEQYLSYGRLRLPVQLGPCCTVFASPVFQLTPPAATTGTWAETVLVSFHDPNGLYGPTSPPAVSNGMI